MISIILPNLNTNLKYLKPRLMSIIGQSFSDWECIVIDGFSDNGSWEFLQEATRGDSRFRLYQKPKKGIYNAWNQGISLAKGEYVYIATSDDTMEHALLGVMVSALTQNPECSIAHCCLRIIDENGSPAAKHRWEQYPSALFFEDTISKPHIRRAPHDGMLHAFIKTVYHSITQLLIRKRVFDERGLFREDVGPIADFEWGLRVSLFESTVHVPEYLATWRVHQQQATTNKVQADPVTYTTLITWVRQNIGKYLAGKAPAGPLSIDDLLVVYKKNRRYFVLLRLLSAYPRLLRLCRLLFPSQLAYRSGIDEAKKFFHEHRLRELVTTAS